MAQEIADSTLLDTWGSSGAKIEPDISKIIEGWQLGEQPPHEYMNWLQNTFGSKLNHILKNGVATWNNETKYLAGSSVQHNGNVWLCKVDNENSEPTDVNANWKRIITVESLTTVLGGYVKNSGDETIAGVKTFSSTIDGSINGNAASATTLSSRGGFPTANGQDFNDLQTTGVYFVTAGNFSGTLNSPGDYGTLFVNNAYPFTSQLFIHHDGTIRGRTAYTSNWGEWSSYVTLSGNQTIAGTKTFSSSPIVPTPTTGTQAANKAYVDSSISSTPTLTGSATFNGTTQNINLTSIGSITLAIGDVIEVTGTTSNNKLFTVESIVDNNNIVVNYEHRGTSTPAPSKRLINETATNCTIKLYNRAKNAPNGQGQDWCVPASGRVYAQNYTNNTNRQIQVAITHGDIAGNARSFDFLVDGEVLARESSSQDPTPTPGSSIIAPVNNGSYYSVRNIDGYDFNRIWKEMR